MRKSYIGAHLPRRCILAGYFSSSMKRNKLDKSPSWSGSGIEQVQLNVPVQFRMLCDLLGVKIDDAINHFMATAGFESHSKGEQAEHFIKEYLITCGYGKKHYKKKHRYQMIRELQAISLLWPKEHGSKVIDRHAEWESMYHKYWYKKWEVKPRRKKSAL